jgi:hypothetical protein
MWLHSGGAISGQPRYRHAAAIFSKQSKLGFERPIKRRAIDLEQSGDFVPARRLLASEQGAGVVDLLLRL